MYLKLFRRTSVKFLHIILKALFFVLEWVFILRGARGGAGASQKELEKGQKDLVSPSH